MASIQSQRAVRESPFRETEWDRRLDDMLEDLENSAASKVSQNSASRATRTDTHQVQVHQQQRSNSAHQQQQSGEAVLSQHNGYGSVIQRSKSGNSLHENADSMLKEMDNALKASSNFIESHQSSSSVGPNSRSTQEFHEYRSYSSGGGNDGGDFNLERQVQHMMPPPSPSLSGLIQRSNQG